MGVNNDFELSNQFTIRRKWKHDHDSARKVCLKYKKQGLKVRYGSSVVNLPDSSYGSLPTEPDIPQDELFKLCLEYLERLKKTARQIEAISELTADDESGEWMILRCERVTVSYFGDMHSQEKKINMPCPPRHQNAIQKTLHNTWNAIWS